MSIVPSSIPTIKIKPSLRAKPCKIIRSSKADGPLRRPSAPSLSPPPLSPPPSVQPITNTPSVAPPKSVEKGAVTGVTFEYQRKMAKEMQDYFKKKKLEESDQGPAFGWVAKNEISNGRWAMFGFAVGLLTEYATGSDFVQQVKILFSNFGILDLD